MKQLLLLTSLAVMMLALPAHTSNRVYVCTGPSSKCYHIKSNCRGLSKCSREVKAVTIEEARQMGRGKPCGYCVGK